MRGSLTLGIHTLLLLVLSLCLGPGSPAWAEAVSCPKARRAAFEKADRDFSAAWDVAQSAAARALPETARALFSGAPPELVAAGHEYAQARAASETIEAARQAAQAQRLAVGDEPSPPFRCLSEWMQHEIRYDTVIAAEKKLDALDYDADRRLTRAKRTLDRLASAYAQATPLTKSYDRAFAWDDRAGELRVCAPGRSGYMLDRRFCATDDFVNPPRFGLHLFASYSIRDAVQSDQVLMLDLGGQEPARFVRTRSGHQALMTALLKDETPDSCQQN